MRRGVLLKHVHRVGKYRYLRAPGRPRVRLPDLPENDPRFLAAYLAAMEGAPETPLRHPAGTVAALCTLYLASADFARLSRDYARVMRRQIDAIREKGAAARAEHLASRHVAADVAKLSGHAAMVRYKAWRALCRWAKDAGQIAEDPARAVAAPRLAKSNGHEPWTDAELARYRSKWPIGTMQRAAMELLHWTGCRIGDAVRLGPQHVGRDGILSWRQSKTGDEAYVPWTCPLPAYAAHMEADRAECHAALAALPAGLLWLATPQGARSKYGLGNLIGAACKAAKVGKSAHGLRKTRAVALAESGATAHEIAAWTGHQTLEEVEHYTRRANRRRLVAGTDPERPAVKAAT